MSKLSFDCGNVRYERLLCSSINISRLSELFIENKRCQIFKSYGQTINELNAHKTLLIIWQKANLKMTLDQTDLTLKQ